MFCESSPCLHGQHGSFSSAQLPVELYENIFLFHKLPPQTVQHTTPLRGFHIHDVRKIFGFFDTPSPHSFEFYVLFVRKFGVFFIPPSVLTSYVSPLTSLHGLVQERLSVGVDVVDVRLVLDERLGEGLLPAGQRNVQGQVVAVVKGVDANRELEEER